MTENLPQKQEVATQFIGSTFQETLQIAEFFAKSDLIPAHFRGKPANVFIALELSYRMGVAPFMLMQNIYVVHGKPGIEAKLAIALARKEGWTITYDTKRDADGKIVSCTAIGEKNGVRTIGVPITWEMVKAEGWLSKDGSKWKTLWELMFKYRAAVYLIRTAFPEVLFGLQTVEELEDSAIDIPPLPQDMPPPAQLKAQDEGPSGMDLVNQFETRAAMDGLNLANVARCIQAIADHKKTDVNTVIAEQAQKYDKFLTAFKKWEAKNAPQEAASAPPVAPEPETNGKAQVTAPGPVMAITGEQIERIEELEKIKDCPREVLLERFNVSAITELSEEVAYQVIDWLAGR